jgi:serine/threonine-protein kinase HipA
MSLEVNLNGERAGSLFPAGEGDCRFAYNPDLVKRVEAGASLLSAALPARVEPFGADATRAYVEGLLPDGECRGRVARELGLDFGDAYGLLAEIGRDCAGAVTFLPEATEVPAEPEPVSWLDEDELGKLVSRRPPQPSPDGAPPPTVRATLAGRHHKLALVREGSGRRWGLPSADRPSTHILKPETGEYPGLVANEMFCLAVAREIGLPVADAEVESIAGRPCLVVRRFDRAGEGESVTRVHQEDFCQALGFPPGAGADAGLHAAVAEAGEGEDGNAGGPGFADSCGLLKAVGRGADVPALLTAAIFNYALGNGDAHGKNFALLYGEGGPRLAPFYDLTSTVVYDLPIHTGMVLAEYYEEHAYLVEMDYVCQECDYRLNLFRELVSATAAKIGACLEPIAERARDEGWHAPVVDEIVELASERALGIGYEVEY